MSSHIPPWATKVVDASGKYDASTFVTSTQQSANLFRIECARIWQQRIHRAQRKAWAKTVQTLLDHKAQQKSNTIESTTPQLAYYSLSPCDPSENDGFETEQEFLSMTIVSPPPTCRLDRQALAEALWDLYQGSRCCSLLLPRLLPTLHSTLHLLTRQCLHTPMHNDPEFYAQSTRFFRKHQKKRHASMQQLLLWWAARTKAFDSMVIVLEDPGGFAESKVRNDFIATIHGWRQDHGLPVSLVIVGPVTVQGDMRLRLRYVQPCRTTWMNVFWQELLNQSETPFPLQSMDHLTKLVREYVMDHRSSSRLCMDLIGTVTNFYGHPWQLVWDGLELHPSFLAWFNVHGTAKKWLSVESGDTKCIALDECQRLQHRLNWWWHWLEKLLPIVMRRENQMDFVACLQSLGELYIYLANDISTPSLPPELERYLDRTGQRKKDEPISATSSLSPDEEKARIMLYELILLLGNVIHDAEETREMTLKLTAEEKMEGISRMLQELFELVVQSMDGLLRNWEQWNPLNKSSNKNVRQCDRDLPFTSRRHRQEIIEGLCSPAKELYGLLQDRLSIPRDEWLYQSGGSVQDFAQGVWTLLLLGLIQARSKRIGGSNMVYYEKISVVWC